MEFFEKEISFLSKEFDAGTNLWKEVSLTKTATFKELSRTDKDQHKFHFKIISLFTMSPKEDEGTLDNPGMNINLDPDAIYDLTVKGIKTLMVLNTEFTAADKNALLSDSGALFKLGFWLLTEKIAPFFSNSMQT